MNFDTELRVRLGKLVALLSSDVPGEVTAAAGAIDRTLRNAGADWHDLVSALTTEDGWARDHLVARLERMLGLAITEKAEAERIAEGDRRVAARARREKADLEKSRAILLREVDHLYLLRQRQRLVTLIAARGRGVQIGRPIWPRAKDRRAAVIAILSSLDGQGLSDREIARRVGCSPTTVGNIRRDFEGPARCPLMRM